MTLTMESVPFGLDDEPIRIAGALGLPPGRHGRTVSRLTTRSLEQILDLEFRLIATSPSGARIELHTDADALEVELYLTRLQVLDRPRTPLSLDLVVDAGPARQMECPEGAVLQVRGPRHMELVDSPPITVRFDDLGPGMKHVAIWLPHNGFAEVCDVRVPTGSTVTRPQPEAIRWVHYGSSISHCVESRRPTETWPAVVAQRHGLDLLNLGLAGHCHLDQLVARDIRETAPDLVSLKLGVNVVNHDSFRERTFVPALHGFLDTLRDRLPDVPVLVLTSIICPPAETVPGPTLPNESGGYDAVPRHPDLANGSLSVQRIRELVTAVVTSRIAAGDANLSLGDGLRLFGPDDVADLPDSLHPSPEGYLRIADRFSDLAFGPSGCWADRLPAPSRR